MPRIPNAFGPMPFNKQNSIEAISIHEDFVGALATADLVDGTGVVLDYGGTIWWGNEIAGAAVSNIAVVAAVADHPGVIQLKVGSTSPAAGDGAAIQFGAAGAAVQESVLADKNGFYVAAVVRIPDIDAQKVSFGVGSQTPGIPNGSALDEISLVWDPADAANANAAGTDSYFLGQINSAGTDEEVILNGVAYVQNDWVLLEIAADDTEATFRVTTEDGVSTKTLNPVTMPIVGLRPFFAVSNVGSTEEVLDIDAFQFNYLRRDEDGAAGYLGA